MSRHLEIAKRFVQEYRQNHKNLVGALLVGSAAYGEETEFSDVDLRLIVEVERGEELDRNGIDAWQCFNKRGDKQWRRFQVSSHLLC